MQQEKIFVEGEADAWYRRNPSAKEAAGPDHPVLAALGRIGLPERGRFLDVGGAAGSLAAGFKKIYPFWECRVIEPSRVAVEEGRRLFPDIEFTCGSASDASLFGSGEMDIVTVCGVLCWIDRLFLSRVMANIEGALKDGGLLVIRDFDPGYPRANPYHHRPGLYTYKMDYPRAFEALGIYQLVFKESVRLNEHSSADQHDLYDQMMYTAVLRKDLRNRFYTPMK